MAGLTLYEKLDQIEHRYVEMTAELSSPEILGDSANYQKLARRHAELSEMVDLLTAALEVVPVDRLWVNPDCGLKTRGVDEVTASLRNLVAAAAQVRAES